MKKTFFVLAAVIIGNQLTAQTDTTSLGEIVVTANKFPNKTSLTGKVVTVITKEQLEKSGGKTLSQVLTEQAGVYIGGANSNAGKDKSLYLRGAGVAYTLVTIDGVPAYDASGVGSNFDIRNLSVDLIERIEILKGSQSTLYGSDAIAGVINIITRKGGTKPFGVNALLGYGSNNTFQGNAGITGKSGIIDYNLSTSFYDTKGINEAISNNGDKDGFTQNNVQASIGMQATKDIRIQPYFRYSNVKGNTDQGAFTDELDYTYEQKNYQLGVINDFSLGKTTLKLLYNYNNTDRLYIDDSVKSRNGWDTYTKGTYKAKEHFIDAYITAPLNKILKLTAGADLRFSSTDQLYIAIPAWAPPVPVNAKMNQQGIYAALGVNTTKGFNLELGNRVNFHSEYGSNYVFNINPSYLISNKVKLFANLSSAYRTPSLYQLFSEYGNRDLKPESAITTEAGVQYFAADNKFTGRITGFNRNVKDVIFFYYNAATFQSQYINQDKQKDYGAELELSFKPAKNLSLKAFYTYVDGKITTVQNDKDTTYFNLLRRPKHSVGLNAGINITENFFVSTNLAWFGKREDAYYDNTTFSTVNVTLDDYALWDIYAEYGLLKTKLKLFADFRNITDTKYNETAGFNTVGVNAFGGIRFNF